MATLSLRQEATELLQELIRVETVNPPGNEGPAQALLRDRLGIRVVSVTQPIGDDPSDPSFFLAESIHEMFDEYYSVSLSFWTRTGLREKARPKARKPKGEGAPERPPASA